MKLNYFFSIEFRIHDQINGPFDAAHRIQWPDIIFMLRETFNLYSFLPLEMYGLSYK